MRSAFAKWSTALLLACGFFLAALCSVAQAADEKGIGEATLFYHFRPIVTLRTTLVGASPEARVRRALTRIDSLTLSQMTQPIERTPFTVDARRGISLHIGQAVLFTLLEGDLDPEEKISLTEAAERAALEMGCRHRPRSAVRWCC